MSAATAIVVGAAAGAGPISADQERVTRRWDELIVTLDDGNTASVIEPADSGVRRGQHIRLTSDPRSPIAVIGG